MTTTRKMPGLLASAAAWALFLLWGSALAQPLASSISLSQPLTQPHAEQFQSLEIVLNEIRKKKGVDFLYETYLVQNKVVDIRVDYAEKVESILAAVLARQGLQFKKISADTYAIVSRKPGARRTIEKVRIGNSPNTTRANLRNKGQIDRILLSRIRAQAPTNSRVVDVTVTGTIRDEQNLPLPNATVLLKGTNRGALTDENGRFSLNLPDAQGTLIVRYIGYAEQEVEINGRSVVDVQLQLLDRTLDEVVVIGYGEKSRRLMTESIGSIDADLISKVPVAAADQALQGRISGVQVTSVDGTPGSPVAVRIRGVSTVGNTQPLFVIDGIPVGNNSDNTTNPLSTINPSDIESISVLKDASSAAVYGVRAANGVVLITTKRGKAGKPRINFDTYYGVQNIGDVWEMNNTQQYVALTQDAFDNYNAQNGLTPTDPSYLILHPDLQAGGPALNRNTDWISPAINESAPIQNYNLGVSGGTENLNYNISGGYFSQEATIQKWILDRYTFRANADYKIGSRLKVGQTFNISYQEVERGMNGGGDGFFLRNNATMPPFFRIYEDPSDPIPGNRYGFDGNNDLAGLVIGNQFGINDILDNRDRTARILGGIYGELEILPGLFYKSVASVDFSTSKNTGWQPSYTVAELGLDRFNNQFSDSRGQNVTQVYTNTLNYRNTLGDHSFNILAGIEYQKINSSNLGARGANFLSTDPGFYSLVRNARQDIFVSGGAGEDAFVGYLSRLSYDYKSKYLLTATVRRDGTARFSPEDNRRWGTFPSVSAAWRVTEEDFLRGNAIVSELKLRGSWGQLGNANTLAFPFIFQVSTTPDYGLGGSTSVQAPAPVNFVNKDVTWETVETIDFGFDLGLFDNKVNVLATYFRKETRDFLIFLPIPQITGFGSTPINAGTVLNNGIELELGYNSRIGRDFNFNLSANLTTVNNELVELAPGIEEFIATGNYRTAVGFPIGYFYGYETNGLYQTDTEAAGALDDVLSPQGPRAGDIRFVDNNGPADENAPEGQQFSGVPDGEVDFNDRTYLGKTIPDFFYGFNFAGDYKGFDLSIFFQGVAGVQIYNEVRNQAEGLLGGGRNQFVTTQNRWTGTGSSNDMPRAIATDPNSNNRFSDRWIENGGFLRLRNVQLGYTIPQSALSRTKVFSSARIYISASNLITITDYTGLDPEVMTYRSNGNQIGQDAVGNPPAGGSGTDSGNMPQPRILQIGAQLQF